MNRILIVDDEDLIRYSLAAALRQDNTYVRAVECGKDALGEIGHSHYHLCFLDINLPDMNGLDIMKTVRKASPATKIVIMTGSEVGAEMLKSMQENANLLVAKPFDLDRIKLFVARTLGQGPFMCRAGEHACWGFEHEKFENWVMDDEIQCGRQTVMHTASCSMVAADWGQEEISFFAGILEISDTGMCIRTNAPLKPGQLITFKDDPVLRTGVVRWSKGGEAEDSFFAGVQFVPREKPRVAPGSGCSPME